MRATTAHHYNAALFIDAQVASGLYASASEVVRAGLRALQERDAVIEHWLQDQVGPIYDALLADRTRAIQAKDVLQSCTPTTHTA